MAGAEMIRYEHKGASIVVKLDGKQVGTIQPVIGGWSYFPLGHKKGSTAYGTVSEVKRSLEEK